MAQVHALLLISDTALSAEEIMDELAISRGNANMNIRALLDWGLVYKEFRSVYAVSSFMLRKIYGKYLVR